MSDLCRTQAPAPASESKPKPAPEVQPASHASELTDPAVAPSDGSADDSAKGGTSQSGLENPFLSQGPAGPEEVEAGKEGELVDTPAPSLNGVVAPTLPQVIESVQIHFPAIREAMAGRVVASGEALSARGAFDHKLETYSNAQPLDFYENTWHTAKVKRNTLWGGELGAGYKVGRGSFEPWYKERETNDGGEFGLSIMAPIIRDRRIDEYRAELWRAQLEQNRVEPEIQALVILSVRDGAAAYWDWVAAGANQFIAEQVLELGVDRQRFLQRQVDLGEKAPIDLVDNRRIIVDRQAKLLDAQRKVEQTAVKMSLFFRTDNGEPVVVPNALSVRDFPEITQLDSEAAAYDVEFAQQNRPELSELTVVRRQLSVALRQARNETLPDVDGGFFFGQDVGNPTSSDDKSDFELEAILTIEVPLERRKALGKVRQLRGKLAKLRAKTQFVADKIGAEVRIARAALTAAAARVEQTTEGRELAIQMVRAERRLYEEGQSTLFNLNIREKQVADAAVEVVRAQLDYFVALADYTAALGLTDSQEPDFLRNDASEEEDEDGGQGDALPGGLLLPEPIEPIEP
ncbi:MAG: TolC family protein [Planctomycetota bacterium]